MKIEISERTQITIWVGIVLIFFGFLFTDMVGCEIQNQAHTRIMEERGYNRVTNKVESGWVQSK